MKVIGIAGSLRARSNTLHYVKTGLQVLEKEGIQSELISLRGKEIKPCNGCYDCVEKGYCTIENDEEGLKTVLNFTKNMADVMRKIFI